MWQKTICQNRLGPNIYLILTNVSRETAKFSADTSARSPLAETTNMYIIVVLRYKAAMLIRLWCKVLEIRRWLPASTAMLSSLYAFVKKLKFIMFRLSNYGSSLLSGEKRGVLIELNCGFERNYRIIFFDVSWVDAWQNGYFIVFVGRVRSQHSYQLTASRLAVRIKNHSRRQMELCHGGLVWRQSRVSFPVTPFKQTLNTRVKQSRISVVTS